MLTCCKAYDIRGQLGADLDEGIARRIGRAYGEYLRPRSVVVGCDARLSSPALKQAVAEGLMDAGVDVVDIGQTGTEEVNFAAFHLDVDGGIEITASHNPMDYNGMKLVRGGAQPISGDTGLREIERLASGNTFAKAAKRGTLRHCPILSPYVDHLLGYIEPARIRPLRLVANAGNGVAGHVVDALEVRFRERAVPLEFIKVHHEPDPAFPNGIPNPLLPENRAATAEAVREHRADMGLAWDGDFDRCFFFDEAGKFIEGYYIVGLLAAAFLARHPGEKIIHDPRLTWNTIDIVRRSGGIPVQSKTGHAFIKERMRAENAIYGGEMSAHHYFREFAYCDSGMIPWLLVAELMSTTGKPLSSLVGDRETAFPCSGEINYRVDDAQAAMQRVEGHFIGMNPLMVDRTDGIGLEFADWRFNLRSSNTEPLLRLNVEAEGNVDAIAPRIEEIEALIQGIPKRKM
ncbi:MAG: phosphomannomutase CpsG [Desulfobulbus sp.]|jgi:phosphomannomutase/phosphomannomutase/phosphoglucomutase|nr:phosphomannomutase CpsG [Desulfobulbus sp.]MDR2551070.1 phosphomannomutase CpsG [Desulfobulbus sp.]